LPARTPEEIRASVIEARQELGGSVAELREKVGVLTDWRRQLNEHRNLAIGAAVVVGFVVWRRRRGRR
jgi:transposase-like protein